MQSNSMAHTQDVSDATRLNSKRLVKIGLGLSVGACIVWSVLARRETIETEFSKLTLLAIGFGLASSIVYRVANTLGWWFVLRGQAQPLPFFRTIRIWLVAETCRWLPGSVWSYGSRAVMGKNAGLTTAGATSSVALELVLTILAWAAVAFATVLFVDVNAIQNQLPSSVGDSAYLPLIISTGLIALGVGGFVLSRFKPIRRKVGSLLGDLRQVRPTKSGIAISFAYCVSMVLLNGVTLYLFARCVLGEATPSLGVILFANSLGWLVGFAAPFAPGGLVVREAAFAAALATCVPVESGLSLAITWRILQIGAEIVCVSGIGASALVSGGMSTASSKTNRVASTQQIKLDGASAKFTTS